MEVATGHYVSTELPGNFIHLPDFTNTEADSTTRNETLIRSGPIFSIYENAALGIYIYPIVVLVIFIVIGMIGNALVLHVFTFKWKRTKTTVFIITLAALDITNCSVIMPIEVYILSQPFSFDFPNFCKVARCFSYIVTAAYSFVLVAVAFDRYLLVCRPLKRMTLGKRYATRTCIGAIILAILTQWPSSFLYGTFTFKLPVTLSSESDTVMSTAANITDIHNAVFIYGTTCLVTNYYYYINRLPTFLFQGFLFFGHVIIFITLAVVYIVIGRKLFISSYVNIEDQATKQGLLKASIVSALTGNTLAGVRSAQALNNYTDTPSKKSIQSRLSTGRGDSKNIHEVLKLGNRTFARSLTALSTLAINDSYGRTVELRECYGDSQQSFQCISSQVGNMPVHKQSLVSLTNNSCCSSNGMSRSASLDISKLHSVDNTRVHKPSGDIKELSIKRNTLIMRMVTFTFILSYLPFLVLVTLRYSDDSVPTKLDKNAKIVYHVFLRSYFLNSVIRPFIYIVMNEQYRAEVLAITRLKCHQ